MVRSISIRGVAAALTFAALTACGGSSKLANPAAPSAAPALNLAGAWSGTLRELDNSDEVIAVEWTADQSGSSATGRAILHITEDDGRASFDLMGTLTVTVSGTQAALTFTVPAGAFADAPGCAVVSNGTAPASDHALTARMNTTFSPACVGTIVDDPTEIDELQLSKR